MKQLASTKVTVRLRKAEDCKEWYVYIESYPVYVPGKQTPQRVREYLNRCITTIDRTSYIEEVGLDFSREGYSTKEIQIKTFEFVLDCTKNKSKIISLHSRRAEKDVLDMLIDKNINKAIFHWYSGSLSTLHKIVDLGYYFSINSAMVQSDNGKKIIAEIPKKQILTETDCPFIENSDITSVHKYLAQLWEEPIPKVEQIIDLNFKRILQNIK